MIKTAAVVGAGITGCTIARALADKGIMVTVFERDLAIGGLCRDGYEHHGIFIHHYGPHIFHNNDPCVQYFLSRFTQWLPYRHHVVAAIEHGHAHVPIPINRVTMSMLSASWSEEQAHILLYSEYGRKMWGGHYGAVRDQVERRVPARVGNDCSYFGDCWWQGFPLTGWTTMMRRMLDADNIALELCEVTGKTLRDEKGWDIVFWTGRPEPLLDWGLGPLAYRTMDFTFQVGRGNIRPPYPVINYPLRPPDYIRATDYRQLTGQPHELWVIGYETPRECGATNGRPTHVVPSRENHELWQRYAAAVTDEHPHVRLVGRFAECRYLDISESVANALAKVDEILA